MTKDKEARDMLQVTENKDGDLTKKSYQSPQLRIYGDIREVTQGTGHHGNKDSPSNPGGHKSLP